MLTRRGLIAGSAGALAGAWAAPRSVFSQEREALPVVVSTWNFGPKANAVAWEVLKTGGSALDAVEKGVNQAELDPENESVGYGGSPNELGETTLDAMIMWGPTHELGAVGCLKRVKKAVSVARKVMEETRHSLLVGEDATRFALKMGFEEESLFNERSIKMWEGWKAKGGASPHRGPEPREVSARDHDTIGMIALDRNGDICAGCSTNGLDFKTPGRVGDSPIVGAGAYCDNDVGAAAATGNGDVMIRFLPSYQAVENMRAGMSPTEACEEALARILRKGYRVSGALIAVSKDGTSGAACMGYDSFPYAVRNPNADELRTYRRRP